MVARQHLSDALSGYLVSVSLCDLPHVLRELLCKLADLLLGVGFQLLLKFAEVLRERGLVVA